jgi:hypothetical protein
MIPACDRQAAARSVDKEDLMRKLVGSCIVVVLIALTAFGTRSGAGAQDTTTPDHPLVGTWLGDTDTADPDNAPELFIAWGDGAWLEVDAEGSLSIGRWESTGAQTANLTIWSLGGDEEGGFGGTFVIRAMIEVAADGQTLTASYTGEFIGPDGSTTGEHGPGAASATRLAVEPMGAPVGSFAELFEQFEGATPEASPAP